MKNETLYTLNKESKLLFSNVPLDGKPWSFWDGIGFKSKKCFIKIN